MDDISHDSIWYANVFVGVSAFVWQGVCVYVCLCSCLMFISRRMANEPKMTQEVYVDNQDLAMLISRDFP